MLDPYSSNLDVFAFKLNQYLFKVSLSQFRLGESEFKLAPCLLMCRNAPTAHDRWSPRAACPSTPRWGGAGRRERSLGA